jgi:hypothetical protein
MNQQELIADQMTRLEFANNNVIHNARYLIAQLETLIENVKSEPMGDWSRDTIIRSLDIEFALADSAVAKDEVNEALDARLIKRKKA